MNGFSTTKKTARAAPSPTDIYTLSLLVASSHWRWLLSHGNVILGTTFHASAEGFAKLYIVLLGFSFVNPKWSSG